MGTTPLQTTAAPLPSGGNCAMQGCDTPATRRQRASHGAKPPPLPVSSALQGREGQDGAPVGGGNPATAHAEGATAKQISPSTSRTAQLPVQNSPSTPPRTACAVQNSPCSPEMAQFGAIYACRESFVPFSPPRSQAGRILYRTRGRDGASQHNRTPGPTCVEGAGGTGVEGTGGTSVEGTGGTGGHGRASRHRAWPRCQWITGPGRSSHKQQQHPAQANFACNSPTTRIDTRSKTAEYQRSDFNS